MKLALTSIAFLAVTSLFTSCGPSKELTASQAQVQQLQTDLSSCKTSLSTESANANAKISDLNNQVSNLTAQNAALSADAMAYRQFKSDKKAQREYVDAYLAEQGTSLKEIREKLVAALSALMDSGIDITIYNGFLYLTLPESILFKEGSASLGKKSAEAFSAVSNVLNNYPKVQIYVVGHTDSVTIHNAMFKDNWSLSTERANSIVRILRDKYKVDPVRLLAGGRSKYNPIAPNTTKEGRATNRRIQIVLNPMLNGLWHEVLQTN